MINTYTTKDFYLCSFLMASGHRLLGHTKTAGLTVFEFEQTSDLDNRVTDYYSFTASVNPISMGNAIRTLKTIIHSNTNGTEQYHTRTGKAN